MKVFILTREKTIYKGEAISLHVPGFFGSFQLLDHHASMISLLREGNLNIQSIDNYFIFCIKNGLLEINNSIVKIILY